MSDFSLKISSRNLLDGLFDAYKVPERRRLPALRAIDKLDRVGLSGVKDLLSGGRLDPSGAFTKGAGLTYRSIDGILSFISSTVSRDRTRTLDNLWNCLPKHSATFSSALRNLSDIDGALMGLKVSKSVAVFDPTIVRGLEYYTGPVFEADLTLKTTDDRGTAVRFGSVGGGGRYDDLVARFTGKSVPATGFSFGVSRLAAALAAAGRGFPDERGPVVVVAFDRERMGDYFAACAELRAAGLPAEVYLGESGMRAQLKYADRRMSPAAVIMGEDEILAGEVTIKDLDLGRALSQGVQDNAAWRAERPGQVRVARAELVSAIRAIVGADRDRTPPNLDD